MVFIRSRIRHPYRLVRLTRIHVLRYTSMGIFGVTVTWTTQSLVDYLANRNETF